MQPKNRVPR